MRLFYVILTSLIFVCCGAQNKNLEVEAFSKKFQKSFNTSNFDQFHDLISNNIDEDSSLKLKESLTKLKNGIGLLKNIEFLNKNKNIYSYKALFEMASLKFLFTMGDDDFKLKSYGIDIIENTDTLLSNKSKAQLNLPFKKQWYVFWGGSDISQNYHNRYSNMYGHFDFWVMGINGKSHKKNPKNNTDFYAFAQEIIAPCNAKVIWTIQRVKDNIWPNMNTLEPYGNLVLLETKDKEYLLFAHLKNKSIVVKKGEEIKKGEKLALCGNSGNSTEPHLHFGVLNTKDLISGNGLQSFFKKIKVNGKIKRKYLPVKGDKISNI